MKNEFLLAIGQLAAEKNLPREVVFEAVEAALSSAYRRNGEQVPNVYVKISPETGECLYYRQMTVVDDVEDPTVEMTVAEARRYKRDAGVGEVLDFEEKPPENAGRIAAQTAKQVVMLRLREAEREAIYDEFSGKEGELVVGTVQRVEPRAMTLDLGRGTEAILPFSEQVRNEHPRAGQRVKVVILKVSKEAKGPQILVSRSHRNVLRRLFELEVPEIRSGIIEIKSIAREGGHRSKVAVSSRDPRVDPIGACVGMRGSRIQNIVNELGGERIDVIKWDPDPGNFVSNALSPAQVLESEVHPDERRAEIVVPDRMLSLAIGKEGQNARLAAKLTGWRIDIRSQSAAERAAQGLEEAASSFEPFAPGEEPDIDVIAQAEEVAAAATLVPAAEEPVAPAGATAGPAAEGPRPEEEDVSFTVGLQAVPIPDRDERESEDYGEEEEEEEGEEYEVPELIAPEERPTTIRFAEDVLPKRPEEEEAKKGGKKVRRPARYLEEGDDDEFEYSGRIR